MRYPVLTIIIGVLLLLVACTGQVPATPSILETVETGTETSGLLSESVEEDFGNIDATETSPQSEPTGNTPLKKITPASVTIPTSTSHLEESNETEPTVITATDTSEPTVTLSPDAWMDMPVIPEVSDNSRQIYQRGLEMGNNPHAFSKVGDCQNVPSLFLAVFDRPARYYRLGDYQYLDETIDWYAGSWGRESLAVRGGYNGAALLNPLMADKEACGKNESPLECELRIHRPSIVIVSLETWWSKKPAETYEAYMRPVIEYIIAQGAVPILATKADNLEGDHSINATIVKLALEYDIPLWNFWKAVQHLPDKGLQEDGFHLTYANNYFDSPWRMQNAWPIRNLTALQSLEAVKRGVMADAGEQP